jgi:hypothetical protein
MILFPQRHVPHPVEQLQQILEHICQLQAQVTYLSAQIAVLQATPPSANRLAPTPSQTTGAIPRRPNLQLMSTRQIAKVTLTKGSKQVISYDQGGIPWLEYSGPFRQVGHKILRIYSGRWQEIDNSSQNHA